MASCHEDALCCDIPPQYYLLPCSAIPKPQSFQTFAGALAPNLQLLRVTSDFLLRGLGPLQLCASLRKLQLLLLTLGKELSDVTRFLSAAFRALRHLDVIQIHICRYPAHDLFGQDEPLQGRLAFPTAIFGCKSLASLELRCPSLCPFDASALPDALGNLQHLQQLVLINCQVQTRFMSGSFTQFQLSVIFVTSRTAALPARGR